MSFINKEGLIAESKDSLASAQRRLDRYENLLIGHISGGKSLEGDLSKMVQDAVAHYRREVENLRLVYLEALKQLEQAVDQITQPFPLPEAPLPAEEEEGPLPAEEEEEEEGPPQII